MVWPWIPDIHAIEVSLPCRALMRHFEYTHEPAALERKLLGRGIEHRARHTVTFIVHASKGNDVAITIRLQAVAAVAKARSLADAGWRVHIIGPDDVRYLPAEFNKLLACLAS